MLEFSTNSWFIVELILRFITSPRKKDFVQDASNWIDVTIVAPYFIIIATLPGKVHSLGFLRCFRFVRVLRLFRLSKHNKGLQIIIEVLKSCAGDLQMLFVCLVIVLRYVSMLLSLLDVIPLDSSQLKLTLGTR